MQTSVAWSTPFSHYRKNPFGFVHSSEIISKALQCIGKALFSVWTAVSVCWTESSGNLQRSESISKHLHIFVRLAIVRCCLKSFRPLSSVRRSPSEISVGISTSIPSLWTIIFCETAGSAFSGSAPLAIHFVFTVAVVQVTLWETLSGTICFGIPVSALPTSCDEARFSLLWSLAYSQLLSGWTLWNYFTTFLEPRQR